MPEFPLNPGQTASGTGIAQAANGGTASVSIGYTAEEVSTLFAQMVGTFGQGLQIKGDMVLASPIVNVDPPPAPDLRLARPELEREANEILLSGSCLSIYGDVGSGRTELARSLSDGSGSVSWIDLDGNQHIPALVAVDLVVRNLPTTEDTTEQEHETNSKHILVIDNIDAAVLEPTFEARVRSLAKSGHIRLVLISIHPLPAALKAVSGSVEVKRLDEGETAEMMKLYGAPPSAFQEGLLNVALGATRGMPDLVTLLLREWQAKNWKVDDAGWLEALQFDYAKNLRAETQRRLLATQDAETRELLYRLTLLTSDFGEEDSAAIASVETAIDRVQERLSKLSGSWLQRTRTDRWRTSPLLAGMGSKNLSFPTRISVHSTAANRILSKKTLGPFDISEAIAHWIQAERWNEAGLLYIRAMEALRVAPIDAYPGVLMSFWKGLPLPTDMHLWLKIFVRGLQALNALRRGQEHEYAVEDLWVLLEQAREPREKMSAFVVSGMLAMNLVQQSPDRALPFILSAVRAESDGPAQLRQQLNDHSAHDFYWLAAMQIKSQDGVLAWMRDVNQLTVEQRSGLMRAQFATPSALTLFDSQWLVEQNKPEEARDWPAVLACLQRCEDIASSWSEPLISACIVRARLCVQIVHLEEMTTAQQIGETFYKSRPNDEVARFIVADGLGTWFTDAKRWDLAATWITRAYGFDQPDLPLHRHLTSLRYGQLLLREGAPSVLPFERAISTAVESDEVSLFFEVKARAELATFFWKTGETNDLFQTWSTVATMLLAHREDSDEWKGLFMLAANNMSFYCSPNIQKEVEAKLVTEPYPGMFQGGGSQLISRYRRELVFVMAGGMAQWADQLGKEREASEWAKTTGELMFNTSGSDLPKNYQMHAIPFAIREHRFTHALRLANETAIGMACEVPLALSDERQKEMEGFNLQRRSHRPFARRTRLFMGLLPCLLEIAIDAEREPQTVRDRLISVRDQMRVLSVSDPEIWAIGIELVNGLLSGTLRTQADVALTAESSGEHREVTMILGGLAIWIAASEPASKLLAIQASTVSYLSSYFSAMGQIGITVAQSIGKMWVQKIEHSPYLYRSPSSSIREIRALAEEGRLGEVLLVAANAVGVSLNAETKSRFRGYRTHTPLPGWDRVRARA